MDTRKALLQEIREILEKNAEQQRDQLRIMGDHLSRQEAGEIPRGPLREPYEKLQELYEQREVRRKELKKISKSASRFDVVVPEFESLKRREVELLKQGEGLFDEIGREVYRIYEEDLWRDEAFAPAISEIGEKRREIEQMERSAEIRNSKRKSLPRRILQTGRRMYLKSGSALKKRGLERSYSVLGREVCTAAGDGRLSDSALLKVVEPYSATMVQLSEVQTQRGKLERERDRLQEELAGLKASRPQSRINGLEKDLVRLEDELTVTQVELGKGFAKGSGKGKDIPEAVKRSLSEIKALEELRLKEEKRKERVQASLEIEELERNVERMRRKIQSLEGEISRRQSDIEEIKKNLSEMGKERGRLETIRGTEVSFLEEVTGRTREKAYRIGTTGKL